MNLKVSFYLFIICHFFQNCVTFAKQMTHLKYFESHENLHYGPYRIFSSRDFWKVPKTFHHWDLGSGKWNMSCWGC